MPPLNHPRLKLVDLSEGAARNALDTDHAFDLEYPQAIRARSSMYWTPLSVVRSALAFIEPTAETRVLDVGAGAGKFCIAGALLSPGQFDGAEVRGELIDVARQTAATLGAANARFIQADALSLDWRPYDVLYFYNPFQELDWTRPDALERAGLLELSQRYVSAAKRKLAGQPVGSRVILYYGFGAEMPEGFTWLGSDRAGPGDLEHWVKSSNSAANDIA